MNLSQTLSHITASLPALWAEYALVIGILAMIIGMLIFKEEKILWGTIVGILTLSAAIIAAWLTPQENSLFMGMLHTDGKVRSLKILLFLVGIFTLIYQYFLPTPKKEKPAGEWFPLILTLIFGTSLMLMSINLLMMYLSAEIVSISAYLLATLRKHNPQSAEAGIKYTLFGAFSSAIMIYGISWFYGCTGTLDLTQAAFSSINSLPVFTQSMVWLLIFSGFLFKVNAVPFHFWTPDVYEGTDFGTAAIFSVVPKIGAFAMWAYLIQLFSLSPTLQIILTLLAIFSMTVGNVAAIGQSNIKRLLAYSSIAHSGFLMLGLVPQSPYAYKALFFYLTVYACMSLVIFFATGYISTVISSEKINDFQGLGTYFPFITVCLAILMFSLTGLPPTAGFIAKWYLFLAIWEKWAESQQTIWLVALIAAVLNTVVALSYYLRVPAIMVFRPTTKDLPPTPNNTIIYLIIGILTALLVIGGLSVNYEL